MRDIRWLATALVATSAFADTPPPEVPCSGPEYRQFDFWVGDWEVFTPDGRKAGTNTITVEYGGCVLHERYRTPGSYRGESLNSYDPVRGLWHQTWVDNAGTLLLLEGSWDGKVMQLTGENPTADGGVLRQRIRWTPLADGSVRQLWQQSTDGEAWQTVFDGKYRRQSLSQP